MKPLMIASIAAATAACLPSSTLAQAASGSHDSHHAAPAQAGASEWVDAEVRRIDLAGRKLTLKHAEIKHLDMPGMTMVFGLKDGAASPELLASLKPGDKLQIQVQMLDGKTVVSALKR